MRQDSDPGAAGAAPGLRETFVGRDDESLALIELTQRAARERRLCMVTWTGEPGVGKSRLAREMARALPPLLAGGRVLAGETGTAGAPPYLAFAAVLERRFGIAEGESDARARERILSGVLDALPDRNAGDVAHLVAHLMRRPFPGSGVIAQSAESPTRLEMRIFIALRRLLGADAERGPLVLILDGLERAQPEAVNLVHYLADGLAALPVVICCLGRPGMERLHAHWGKGDYRHERRLLGPLPPGDAEAMAAGLIGCAALPAGLRDAVRALRPPGVPRALEELARYLMEAGALRGHGVAFVVDDEALACVQVPGTHEQILAARLRALPGFERRVLEIAAAVGEHFWIDAVVALLRADAQQGGDPDGPSLEAIAEAGDARVREVESALGRLAARGLIVARRFSQIPGVREFRFAYPPIREMACRGADAGALARHHALAARWMDLCDLPDDRQEEVARHLRDAGEVARAALCYQRAGNAARARYLNDKAVRLYRAAIECVEEADFALRARLWLDLGSVHELVGRYDEARDAFERLLRLSYLAANPAKGAVALNKIGRIWRRRGDLGIALDYLERGLDLFRQVGDPEGVAASLDDVAYALHLSGRLGAALERAGQALEMRRRAGDRRSIALTLSNIGNIERDRGLFDAAESCHREALELRRQAGDRAGEVISLDNLGELRRMEGDHEEARRLFSEALAKAESIGATAHEALVRLHLGALALEGGRIAEARKQLHTAGALGRDLQSRRILSEVERCLGLCALAEGDHAAARASCRSALESAEQGGIPEFVARSLLALAEVEAAAAPAGASAAGAAAAGAPAAAAPAGASAAGAAAAGPDAAAAAGAAPAATADAEQPPARRHFSRAVEILREIGADAELARALERFGEHLVESGDTDRGRALLDEARALYSRLGFATGEQPALRSSGSLEEITGAGSA